MGDEVTLLAERTAYSTPFVPTTQRRAFIHGKKSTLFSVRGAESNRALLHALAQIESVSGASKPTLGTLRWILSRTLEDDMAYATLSSDGDGGALAQWRAGRSYIAIEIGVSDHSFTYSDEEGRLVVNEAALDCDQITSSLRAFTRYLDLANPDWRAHRKANGR